MQNSNELKICTLSQTWLSSVNPAPFDSVVNGTSVSANPDRSVLYLAVRLTHYELLKHVVDVLICDDRQRCVLSHTKSFRFIPIQHRTAGVETIVLAVHRVTFRHLKFCGQRHCWNITCNISKIFYHILLIYRQWDFRVYACKRTQYNII